MVQGDVLATYTAGGQKKTIFFLVLQNSRALSQRSNVCILLEKDGNVSVSEKMQLDIQVKMTR